MDRLVMLLLVASLCLPLAAADDGGDGGGSCIYRQGLYISVGTNCLHDCLTCGDGPISDGLLPPLT